MELVSTGGTAKLLREAGLEIIDVAEITRVPEMMDGRVKTLHPKIHGGLLAVRGNEAHERALKDHAIPAIDLLVVNLYPFEMTVRSRRAISPPASRISISAALPSSAPARRTMKASPSLSIRRTMRRVLAEMDAHDGATTPALRKALRPRGLCADGSVRCGDRCMVCRPAGRSRATHAHDRGRTRAVAALWGEPASMGRLLPHGRAALRRGDRGASSRQRAFLQQHQRHRRGL